MAVSAAVGEYRAEVGGNVVDTSLRLMRGVHPGFSSLILVIATAVSGQLCKIDIAARSQ